MLPIALAAALAMQKIDEKNKKEKARNQAQADVWNQQAADMGAPSYMGQAVERRNKIDDIEGEDYLSELMQYQEALGKSKK